MGKKQIMSCLMLIIIVASFMLTPLHIVAHTDHMTLSLTAYNDSNTVSGSNVTEGMTDDELGDTPSALLLPTRPDTLPAYTLGGQRMDREKTKHNTRTLYIYNIVIKNGRKIVKRDR